MYIVEPQYSRLTRRMSPRTWERIKAKARWEHESLSFIIHEWPMLLPKRLQPLIPHCFAESRHEMLCRRITGLKRELREAERDLVRIKEGTS
jgi:hypothetical protein